MAQPVYEEIYDSSLYPDALYREGAVLLQGAWPNFRDYLIDTLEVDHFWKFDIESGSTVPDLVGSADLTIGGSHDDSYYLQESGIPYATQESLKLDNTSYLTSASAELATNGTDLAIGIVFTCEGGLNSEGSNNNFPLFIYNGMSFGASMLTNAISNSSVYSGTGLFAATSNDAFVPGESFFLVYTEDVSTGLGRIYVNGQHVTTSQTAGTGTRNNFTSTWYFLHRISNQRYVDGNVAAVFVNFSRLGADDTEEEAVVLQLAQYLGYAAADTIYVSSLATVGTGDGTEANPVTLYKALSGQVRAVSTIEILNDGAYTLASSVTTGDNLNGITINGNGSKIELAAGVALTWAVTTDVYDLEIYGQPAFRQFTVQSDYLTYMASMSINGGTSFYGCIVHDLSIVSSFDVVPAWELKACIFYNLGYWTIAPTNHGQFYTHNLTTCGTKTIVGCCFLTGYDEEAWQAYGGSSAEVHNYVMTDCTGYEGRFLFGTEAGGSTGDIDIDRLWLYQRELRLGWSASNSLTNVTLDDAIVSDYVEEDASGTGVTVTGLLDLDVDTPPVVNSISVISFAGQGHRFLGKVRVWNFEGVTTDDIDISGLGLPIGNYKFWNAFNPSEQITKSVPGSGVVTMDLEAATMAVPIGETDPTYIFDSPAPTLNVWYVSEV